MMKKVIVRFKALLTALFLVVFIAGTINVSGKNGGYKITVRIKGVQDTLLYLAHYYGDKTYLDDTAFLIKGKYVFEGDSVLPGGIYIVAGQKNNRYFEFIIDKEQIFSISTDVSDIPGKMTFKGSEQNTLFYKYIVFNTLKHNEIAGLRKRMAKYAGVPDSVEKITGMIDKINKELNDYQSRFTNNHPGMFLSVLFNAMWEPEPDTVPVLSNGREDSLFVYRYYKKHYWDRFDLTDDRLLRTPLYHNKLAKYFDKIIIQIPDTIIREADALIKKTEANKEMFKYTVWYLTYKYQTSKIMGFDRIFVHLVDEYYITGKAFWAPESTVKALGQRADALRKILIGEKAPELILIDTAGNFRSLHHTNAGYLIVLFYEYGCGHCQKEIRQLKNWTDSVDFDLKVFAVCTDTNLVKWKKFIYDYKIENWINVNGTRSITADYHDLYDINMTPTLFLLDERKRIIAKGLKTEQLKPFLENHILNERMKKEYDN